VVIVSGLKRLIYELPIMRLCKVQKPGISHSEAAQLICNIPELGVFMRASFNCCNDKQSLKLPSIMKIIQKKFYQAERDIYKIN
jgi:hypothetical protein